MSRTHQPGLGELLRHLLELVDGGAERAYQAKGLSYRPRYTPIMRCISRGCSTITGITADVRITQGAVSQTVKLMEADGLIRRESAADTRSSVLSLTDEGLALLAKLERHWSHTFAAIEALETEIGHPLRTVLEDAITSLEAKDFGTRISDSAGKARVAHG